MNPILALIIANVIWGGASPIFKYALHNIPPFTLAFIRFYGAAFVLLPFALKHYQRITKKDLFDICLSAFFGVTVNISFFFLGLEKGLSINAPIISSGGPVFIFILSILFLKEKFVKKIFVGMLISLFGVLFIIFSPIFLGNGSYDGGAVVGNIFFALAAIGAVLNTLFNKKLLARINPFVVSCIGFMFSSLTFMPFVPGELTKWSFRQLNIEGWVGIVYGVFFSSAIAYYLFNYAITKLKAEEVGLFTYVDPVAAVLLAIPLVHEYPSVYFIIGSILVFSGIFIAENRVHWHPFHKLRKFNIEERFSPLAT